MSVKQVENFYKDTVKTAWTAGAGNFYLSTAAPTVYPGILVVSPGDASKREIVRYTAVGTDGGGSYITIASTGDRGLGGTTAQAHAVGEKVRMNLTAENWQEVIDELATKYGPGVTVPTPTLPGDTVNKDYADALAIAGSPNASTSTKGISKLTATPMKSLGTATITIATPGVITLASHGLIAGDTIELTTSGALPTGLSASTTYFVISTGLTADSFQVSLSNGGSAINTTGSQSGTHTLFRTTPFAVGDQDGRLPTQDENDALAGTVAPASGSNKYVTNNDTAENTASKLVRRKSDSNITVPTTPTATTDAASKSYVDGTESFVMGESFTGATTPQPAKIIDDLVQPFINDRLIMGTSSITRRALRIIPRKNCTITSVVFPYVFENAADNAVTWTASIQTDSGSNPSGTAITNGTSTSLALNTNTILTGRYINLTFSTPPSLVAGTTYWVVLTLSSTTASNVSIGGLGTSSYAYASFLGRVWTGSWASGDIPSLELITATGSSKSLWQSDGNGVMQLSGFDGFVTNTGSAGDSATFVRNRTIGGFSSLDVWSDYFLSNTKGSITRNANEGTFIGTAVSATEINIPVQRNKGVYKCGDGSVYNFNESSTTGTSLPIVCPEDAILTVAFKPGVFGGNTQESYIYTVMSYANNTSPKTAGEVRIKIGATSGITQGSVPISIPVKKGERIIFTTSGSGSSIQVSELRFAPF